MLRKVLTGLLLVFAVLLGALFGVRWWADARFYDGYDAAHPLNAEVEASRVVEGTRKVFGVETPTRYRVEKVWFDARPGERVPTLVTLPASGEGPFPAIVLLHGSHQEKEFIEEICTPFNEAGFVMACFDQYMRGERKVTGGFLAIGRAFRVRMWKTVHDARRLVDYLGTRPDIDPARIYLVGASYGAITGTALLAQEGRFRGADLVVGGGDWSLLASAPDIRKEIPGWLHPVTGALIRFAVGPADPVLHAPKITSIPVLMQNGSNDRVVVPAAGEALYAALACPKEIRWYPIDHPDREPDGAAVIAMLRDGLAWLAALDAGVEKEDGIRE